MAAFSSFRRRYSIILPTIIRPGNESHCSGWPRKVSSARFRMTATGSRWIPFASAKFLRRNGGRDKHLGRRAVANPVFWSKRRVLLTGHTGFKGAWMAAMLVELGADVTAFALEPEGEPNLWKMFAARVKVTENIGDLRDATHLADVCRATQPEIVLHLAAQAQVRRGYLDPTATYSTNIMGTVNLLEAVRPLQTLEAIVIVTSDKVYIY